MPIDESLYDQARRYAVALLAEGRTRLRDQEPSVPGALVAEVFWHIESILPHLSRCQLESLILETDKNGANWRKYTCRIPSDHIPIRSWPLFLARELMRDLIETLKAEQST